MHLSQEGASSVIKYVLEPTATAPHGSFRREVSTLGTFSNEETVAYLDTVARALHRELLDLLPTLPLLRSRYRQAPKTCPLPTPPLYHHVRFTDADKRGEEGDCIIKEDEETSSLICSTANSLSILKACLILY